MLTDGKLKLTRVSKGVKRRGSDGKYWKPLFNAKLMCLMAKEKKKLLYTQNSMWQISSECC